MKKPFIKKEEKCISPFSLNSSPFIADSEYEKINNKKEYLKNILHTSKYLEILQLNNLNKSYTYNIINNNDILSYYGEFETFYIIDFLNIKNNTYIISSYGRVFSLNRNIEMKQKITKDGYYEIKLKTNDNGNIYIKTHRLVAMAFLNRTREDNILYRLYINHKDSNRLNNFYKNLEWCTSIENSKHGIHYGKMNGISDDQVRLICKELEKGYSNYKDICKNLNIEYNDKNLKTISAIKRKKFHQDISKDYNFNKDYNINGNLNNFQVEIICRELEKGELNYSKICDIAGISRNNANINTIIDIRYGKSYKNISKNYNISTELNSNSILSETQVNDICILLEKDYTINKIIDSLNLYNIKNRKTYKKISSKYTF